MVSGEPGQGLSSSGQLSSSCLRLRLTLVEVMSIMTSWKAAVSSACRWVCSAIFSLNFRGFDAPEPEPEVGPGPGPQPPEPVADIFTERTGRLDVVERFEPETGDEGEEVSLCTHFWRWFFKQDFSDKRATK